MGKMVPLGFRQTHVRGKATAPPPRCTAVIQTATALAKVVVGFTGPKARSVNLAEMIAVRWDRVQPRSTPDGLSQRVVCAAPVFGRARKVFAEAQETAVKPIGPQPVAFVHGPTAEWINTVVAGSCSSYAACGASGMSGGGSCG